PPGGGDLLGIVRTCACDVFLRELMDVRSECVEIDPETPAGLTRTTGASTEALNQRRQGTEFGVEHRRGDVDAGFDDLSGDDDSWTRLSSLAFFRSEEHTSELQSRVE